MTDLVMEDSADEKRKDARNRLKYIRKHGTIDENAGWSNDVSNRQPERNRYPTPIVPTEDGYPGLEAPLG